MKKTVLMAYYDYDLEDFVPLGRILFDREIKYEGSKDIHDRVLKNVTSEPVRIPDGDGVRSVESKNEPELWLDNLHYKYGGPYMLASKVIVDSSDDMENAIIITDLEPLVVPDDIVDLIKFETSDSGTIEDLEIEKGILSVGAKIVDFFNNGFGRWITSGGRKIFIRLKEGLFGSGKPTVAAAEAAEAYKFLPRNTRALLGKVELRKGNILERMLPGSSVAKLLGKEAPGQGYKVSFYESRTKVSNLWIPAKTVTTTSKVRVPTGQTRSVTRNAVVKPGKYGESEWTAGKYTTVTTQEPIYKFETKTNITTTPGAYKKIFDSDNRLVIYPDRLATLNRFSRSSSSYYKTTVADLVHKGAGYSIFKNVSGSQGKAMETFTHNFISFMNREGGVTNYAERMRLLLRKPVLGAKLEKIDVADKAAAQQNFGELYAIYRGKQRPRDIYYSDKWNKLLKTHPRTVEQFLHILKAVE